MFGFLFKKEPSANRVQVINEQFSKIKEFYSKKKISEIRKEKLSEMIEKYGYIPYSQAMALEELEPEEVIFCLEKKLEANKTYKEGEISVDANQISAVKRSGYSNADWIKREQHDIKLINLEALGDGGKDMAPARFIDWLRQLVILPSGNEKNGILSTTVYLLPFHPRDFGNAYLTASSEEVSKNNCDADIKELGLNAKAQVKLFINLAQLAGHPVIYDVFPQNGRFSKTILAHPELARWIDVNYLIEEIAKSVNYAAIKLAKDYDEDDVTIVRNIYKSTLKSGSIDLSAEFKPIYDRFNDELEAKKKELSDFMTKKSEQQKLLKRVKAIIEKVQGVKLSKIKHDKDITKRGEIINALIDAGLWTLPDGAWCSSGIPVFDKMSECGSYPVFRHFNAKGEDVSKFADSDCLTPYYFVYLENGEYNQPVMNYFVNYLKELQKDYNFDGYRMTHSDFVVDEMSEKDLRPISYRAPRLLLKKVNDAMKFQVPYFACMAEYRLWGSLYKEYHRDMNFDLLWGNDVKTDNEKIPSDIINDNRELQNYNTSSDSASLLSIIKTYNNQDGDFRPVNRFLGLMDRDEAMFKWFKFKFLPGGKYAMRPAMYVDGDESFSKDGIEATIIDEVSLIRENDEDFYNKFDAIRRFAINNELTREGEAQIINQQKNGFISWMISKEAVKECLIIAANYLPACERILKQAPDGTVEYTNKNNYEVKDKKIEIPGDFELACEYVWEEDKKEFVEHYSAPNVKTIEIECLKPSEFRIFKIKR
ncbi:hypothetical protein II906_07055 [bacterium]|nr:hypothetical protein [bacterium]